MDVSSCPPHDTTLPLRNRIPGSPLRGRRVALPLSPIGNRRRFLNPPSPGYDPDLGRGPMVSPLRMKAARAHALRDAIEKENALNNHRFIAPTGQFDRIQAENAKLKADLATLAESHAAEIDELRR